MSWCEDAQGQKPEPQNHKDSRVACFHTGIRVENYIQEWKEWLTNTQLVIDFVGFKPWGNPGSMYLQLCFADWVAMRLKEELPILSVKLAERRQAGRSYVFAKSALIGIFLGKLQYPSMVLSAFQENWKTGGLGCFNLFQSQDGETLA